jgi:hypothetical protein
VLLRVAGLLGRPAESRKEHGERGQEVAVGTRPKLQGLRRRRGRHGMVSLGRRALPPGDGDGGLEEKEPLISVEPTNVPSSSILK